MIGYKAFNNDLTCRNFQYEIGQIYEINDEPILCCEGFHFCKELGNVYTYYDLSKDTRVCKIEALGDIKTDVDTNKYCTNKIKILEEIKNPLDTLTYNFEYNNPNLDNQSKKDLSNIQTGDILFENKEGNKLICISKQDNKLFFSFEHLLGCSNIHGIDEWLKNHWNNENIMPLSFWNMFSKWFIPSEYEVFGSWQWGNVDDEVNKPFEYYKYRKNRIKTYSSVVSDNWWERSPDGSNSTDFCRVGISGDAASYRASYVLGVAPTWQFDFN